MIYEIKNDILTVQIASLGAEMVSVKKNGKERMWQNENGGWDGHAPILFPKCGDCSTIIGGVKYPMGGHGIARKAEFSVLERGENFIKMGFSSDEKTKTVYPYDFEFAVTYRLDGEKLSIEYAAKNLSDVPMYAFFGSHESYSLDGEIEEYEAIFPKEESFVSLIHNGDVHGLTGESVDFGKGTRLQFPREFMEDNTLIFANVNSREVEVRKIGGESVCRVWFEGFDNLLFWRPAGSKMICVEPWHNLPDLLTEPLKDISERAGVQTIESNQTKAFTHIIEYCG